MPDLLRLLLQIAVIILAARTFGVFFRKIHQPQVMGEMVAGILLGPSLLGSLFPSIFANLFPQESFNYLYVVSQIGLIIFMFLVGLEVDLNLLKGNGKTTIITSLVSIIVPFTLGISLAFYLYPKFAPEKVAFTSFALFIGTAMSVTAFPVLARILIEQNLVNTKIGAITLTCAAIGDIAAWLILAAVVAVVRATGLSTLIFILIATTIYILVMIFMVSPILNYLVAYHKHLGRLSQDLLAVFLLFLLASSFTTELLGLHALFGAFVFGVIVPRSSTLIESLVEKLEDLTVVFMLPLFFAYIGLRTQIDFINNLNIWLTSLLVILFATVGKFGGATIASKLTGLSWKDASILGILMNTRGLMELVILSIGLDLKIISLEIFAMMVLMTIVTTVFTTPIVKKLRKKELFIIDEMPSGYFHKLHVEDDKA